MSSFDTLIVGAGAAGLFCAALAGERGERTAVLDHGRRIAEKVRISGGGRCNFTNLEAARVERYLTAGDRRFVRTVLRAYPPERFIALLRQHGIDWHEKHRGQLFCDDSSERIIAMLRERCARAQVRLIHPCAISEVRSMAGDAVGRGGIGGGEADEGKASGAGARFELRTEAGTLRAKRLIIATGGLSIPAIGASDFGYRIARQFGLKVIEPRPALVPLKFDPGQWAPFQPLAGVSLPARLSSLPAREREQGVFDEDLLFTHRGLSGPGILQISSYWHGGEPIRVDLTPGWNAGQWLRERRDSTRQQLDTVLSTRLPRRLVEEWLRVSVHAPLASRRLAEIGNAALDRLADDLADWRLSPTGTEGWRKAEVTAGGVDTAGIDPRSMQAIGRPGLHFIGEVVDVTGWLGGYNFQWAWASAWVAAHAADD